MRVTLYARVSSEARDVSLSVSAQMKALWEYAERNSVARPEFGKADRSYPDKERLAGTYLVVLQSVENAVRRWPGRTLRTANSPTIPAEGYSRRARAGHARAHSAAKFEKQVMVGSTVQ